MQNSMSKETNDVCVRVCVRACACYSGQDIITPIIHFIHSFCMLILFVSCFSMF